MSDSFSGSPNAGFDRINKRINDVTDTIKELVNVAN